MELNENKRLDSIKEKSDRTHKDNYVTTSQKEEELEGYGDKESKK